jgi:EAL and modified HD-GYP domain-containing signal transduction protein
MSLAISTGSAPAESPKTSKRVRSSGVGYLSRQPILDLRGGVFGYELHCHEPFEQAGEEKLSPGAYDMLDALALIGVERLAAGSWGFVNCSLEMLAEDMFDALPPTMTVLEIPSCPDYPEKLIRACRNFRNAGFRLALLDFEPGEAKNPLLELVHYVKVEPRNIEPATWARLRQQIHGANVTVVADKIHTRQDYAKARALGIGHFQGFYFCQPELLSNGKIPANRLPHVEILRQLFKDPLELMTLCPLVSQDASLVYRVLRFANSPVCAIRNPVTSIQEAIMVLGDKAFRRVAALAIQSALCQNQSPELLQMALVRARFCAQAASLCGLDADEQYLLGMLSLLPPMLRVPMEVMLRELPLRPEIRDALAGAPVKERSLLTWIEHLEDNGTSGCDRISLEHGLDRKILAVMYLNSLEDGVQPARIR